MRSRTSWLGRLLLALVLLGSISSSIVSAQDATPEASPIAEASPDASPAAEASPVAATCTPGPSITANEQRAL
jgi:hypothetical protein